MVSATHNSTRTYGNTRYKGRRQARRKGRTNVGSCAKEDIKGGRAQGQPQCPQSSKIHAERVRYGTLLECAVHCTRIRWEHALPLHDMYDAMINSARIMYHVFEDTFVNRGPFCRPMTRRTWVYLGWSRWFRGEMANVDNIFVSRARCVQRRTVVDGSRSWDDVNYEGSTF